MYLALKASAVQRRAWMLRARKDSGFLQKPEQSKQEANVVKTWALSLDNNHDMPAGCRERIEASHTAEADDLDSQNSQSCTLNVFLVWYLRLRSFCFLPNVPKYWLTLTLFRPNLATPTITESFVYPQNHSIVDSGKGKTESQ